MSQSRHTGNLLIVEDDAVSRRILAQQCAHAGFDVTEASDGQTALRLIATQSFDVVLLDWMMPGMTGIEVLARLRALFSAVELPVIMVTMREADEDVVFALQRGANDYVSKSTTFPVTLARLHTQVTLRRAEQKLRDVAVRDALTGLYNRRFLMQRIEREISLAKRRQLPLSLCICDIDLYKRVNDQYGHRAGDRVLVEFAEMLRAGLRAEDTAARYGGDEFCVILPMTSLHTAAMTVDRVRSMLRARVFELEDGRNFTVTASFGVSELTPQASTASRLIDAADNALYRAKEQGRNSVWPGIPTPVPG